MWFYIKKGIIPVIYMLFMAVISLGILMINNDKLTWLKIILLILNVLLYVFIIGALFLKEGQEAVKVRHANDMERLQIIKTGEDRPLKLKEEFKWYKGFLMGLSVLIPLFVCLIIHTIIFISVGEEGSRLAGGIAGFIYFMIFSFFTMGEEVLTMGAYYYLLICVPIFLGVCGLPYFVGGVRTQAQYDKILAQQKSIYGDKQ